MPVGAHTSLCILRAASHRTRTFFASFWGSLVTRFLLIALTTAKGNWFKWSTWKKWNKSARKQTLRAAHATALIVASAFVICVALTLRSKWVALQERCRNLESVNLSLATQLHSVKTQRREPDLRPGKLHNRQRLRATDPQITPSKIRELASDLYSYSGEIQANRPQLILSSTSTALTQQSLAADHEYDQRALTHFTIKFSGPIYEVEQTLRQQGIDTSRLETHLAALVNTQMLNLLAFDLRGMADQFEKKSRLRL